MGQGCSEFGIEEAQRLLDEDWRARSPFSWLARRRCRHNIEAGINVFYYHQHEVSAFAMPSLPLLEVGKSMSALGFNPKK